MKRGAPRHPKMLALADALGVERWAAAGMMECLWHFAADYSPRGDIGRHSNRVLAEGIGWRGDPDFLIATLLGLGWFDGCACHRFRLHDWPDHADNGVKGKQEVKRDGFLECYGTPPLSIPIPVRDVSAQVETEANVRLSHSSAPTSATPHLVAVAVAVPSLAKPVQRISAADDAAGKPNAAVAAIPKPPKGAAPWSRDAADDWIARYGGRPNGALFKALEPLVKREGWDRVRPAFRHYLSETAAEYVNAHKFASQFGEWEARAAGQPRASPAQRPTATAQARQESANAMIRGGLGDRRSVGGGDGGPGGVLLGPGREPGGGDTTR